MPDLAVVALGSNLAEPLAQLRRAAEELAGLGQIRGRSSLYRTDPVGGPAGQPSYLNAVITLEPFAAFGDPHAFLDALLGLERLHGRERRLRWGPRTLDLDLLLFGERLVETAPLTLPHPRMMTRAFVLVPLCELLPDLRHPNSGARFCDALAELGTEGVHKMAFAWGDD